MQLIFIHGRAAVGKLTVGRELQALTGLRLFHNHLVVDALLAVFPFGSEPFVRLREHVWLEVFREAATNGVSLIFTFAPETTVHDDFAERVEQTVVGLGGRVHFVELVCPPDEQERRVELPSRAEFRKLRSLETLRALRQREADRPITRPRADLVIDTGLSAPATSARRIADAFGLPTDGGAAYVPYPPP